MKKTQQQRMDEDVSRRIEKAREKFFKMKIAKREEVMATNPDVSSPGNTNKEEPMLQAKIAGGRWVSTVPAEIHNCVGPNGEWIGTELPADWNNKELNVGWPWAGAPPKLLTQAPYAANEHNFAAGFFKLPQEVQTSPLFNIPRGVEAPILQILFQYHGCASKFAATCQSAFNMVASNIHHWDFTRCEYNGCDDPMGCKNLPCSVGKIMVVSQFRVHKWRGENFKCEMYSLQRMTHALVNFASHFEILHLHRIPFLTTHLLEMVVPLMTRLKVLGVYRCELIHVGDTLKLLEIVSKDRNYDSGKNCKVHLDFYPRFHVGPMKNPVNSRKESYGVTWDDFGLDSRLGIWQLLMRILPRAKKLGMDLITKDSAFRFWLEQSPCWRIDDTVEAIERGDDGPKLAVQVNYPKTRGKVGRLAWDDSHWLITKFHCRDCKEDMLGVFFDFQEYTERAWMSSNTYEMLCLGCKLTMHLRFEDDHRKIQKHHMVFGWLGDADSPVQDGDLAKALSLNSKRGAMRYASRYERARKEYVATHEGEETQRPRVKGRKCSPSINDREWHGYW